jgi:hypothetical protein
MLGWMLRRTLLKSRTLSMRREAILLLIFFWDWALEPVPTFRG